MKISKYLVISKCRFVVASRDISPGEVIFTEAAPLVAGPNHECPPVCLACLAPCAATRACVDAAGRVFCP